MNPSQPQRTSRSPSGDAWLEPEQDQARLMVVTATTQTRASKRLLYGIFFGAAMLAFYLIVSGPTDPFIAGVLLPFLPLGVPIAYGMLKLHQYLTADQAEAIHINASHLRYQDHRLAWRDVEVVRLVNDEIEVRTPDGLIHFSVSTYARTDQLWIYRQLDKRFKRWQQATGAMSDDERRTQRLAQASLEDLRR